MITELSQHGLDEITLHENISIPSKVHVYSLGVEYMRDWFLSKFDESYFKTVYINGKYIFDDYRRFSRTELLKIEKPALNITPTVDYEYNRDMVDLRTGGLDVLSRRSRFYQDPIIQDYDNNYFLGMIKESVKINFTFRVRVSTRAQQLDLYNYMKFAYRVGSTQKSFIDYDFHLPYEAMMNIANHNGFEIAYPDKDDTKSKPRIKCIANFLKYLNSHSIYPISYKMRTVNGNCEFFIRVPKLCTHISNLDQLSMDDGEREDQLENNFHIEMNSTLTIPAPQEYFYYSSEALDNKFKVQNEIAGLYSYRCLVPPDKDEHGWRQYISTEYVEEENVVESIDLTELLDGTDLYTVAKSVIELEISPAVFINVKLYNAQYEREIVMDWRHLIMTLKNPKLKSDFSQITVYADMEYLNNHIKIINETDNGRLK